MNHCEIEKLRPESFSITFEGEQRTFLLLFSKEIEVLPNKSIEIVLTYEKPDKLPFEYRTMFIIGEKSLVGPVGEIENKIKEFFRRKGICFYV